MADVLLIIGLAALVIVIAVAVWRVLLKGRPRQLVDRLEPMEPTHESSHQHWSPARARHPQRRYLRPLGEADRERYLQRWQDVRALSAETPAIAVIHADALIASLLADRGYPVEDFEERADAVLVDHPEVLEDYRAAHRIAHETALGFSASEDVELAMKRYEALFDRLLATGGHTDGIRERSLAA